MPFVKHEELPEESNKWNKNNCNHPEHNPPGMIVLNPGIHTYQCPSCGRIQKFIIQTGQIF